jgi:hypothetical protein
MGSNKFLRGVAGGLRGLSKHRAEEKEEERYNKEQAFKERELQVRENESKLRQQQLEISNMMAKAKMNHGNLVKTAMSSGYTEKDKGYGSQAMASAMTKYLSDGRAYRHKGYSDEELNLDPTTGLPTTVKQGKGLPVWEIGTYDTDPETGKAIAGPDGKPIFKPLKDGDGNNLTQTWQDENAWLNFVNSNMNPDYMLALQAEEKTYAQTERDHKDRLRRQAATAKTPQGKADLEHKRQLTSESKAKEAKLTAEAENVGATKKRSTRMGIGGPVERTSQESDNDRAEFNARVKQYPGLSMDQSFTISQIKGGNPQISQAFADSIQEAVRSPEAREQFIKDATGPKVGLPIEFVQDLLDQAEELGAEFAEAKKPAGLLSRTIDVLF